MNGRFTGHTKFPEQYIIEEQLTEHIARMAGHFNKAGLDLDIKTRGKDMEINGQGLQ